MLNSFFFRTKNENDKLIFFFLDPAGVALSLAHLSEIYQIKTIP